MPGGETPDTDLATAFAEIARLLHEVGPSEPTADRIVRLAAQTIDGCTHAGLLLLDDPITSATGVDELGTRLGRRQVDLDEGPSLEVLVAGGPPYVVVDDLGTDARYPTFGAEAAGAGMRSALAVRLATERHLGALELYGAERAAFDAGRRAQAMILATHASMAVDAVLARDDAAARNARDLRDALASRGVIGQAQGILMERERITAEQAFALLRDASQRLNVKLRDVAQRLVDSGEDPRRDQQAGDATEASDEARA